MSWSSACTRAPSGYRRRRHEMKERAVEKVRSWPHSLSCASGSAGGAYVCAVLGAVCALSCTEP